MADEEYDPPVEVQDLPAGMDQMAFIQAMQRGLAQLVGTSSGYLEGLPRPIKNRIAYLEELQEEYDTVEDQLEEEIKALEQKYKPLLDAFIQKRKRIIMGEEEAPKVSAVDEEAEAAGEDLPKVVEVKEDGEEDEEDNEVPPGIPEFWSIAIQNHPMFEEMITEKDAPILESLVDLSVVDDLDEDGDELGYTLTFTFKENEFFSNDTLTLKFEVVNQNGMVQVDSIEGTKIQWKSDTKNPTVKTMKKKPKSGQKSKGSAVKKIKVDSFFNIFSPPDVEEVKNMDPEESADQQEELERLLALGEALREELIPSAIDWFTGAALDQYEDEEEEEEEDDEDDDEDDDEEEEEEDDEDDEGAPKLVDAKDAAECKQQ